MGFFTSFLALHANDSVKKVQFDPSKHYQVLISGFRRAESRVAVCQYLYPRDFRERLNEFANLPIEVRASILGTDATRLVGELESLGAIVEAHPLSKPVADSDLEKKLEEENKRIRRELAQMDDRYLSRRRTLFIAVIGLGLLGAVAFLIQSGRFSRHDRLATTKLRVAIATIQAVEGRVEVKTSEETGTRKAVPEMLLFEGDQVQTFDEGVSIIRFASGGRIRLSQNALVTIFSPLGSAMNSTADANMDAVMLEAGRLQGKVPPSARGLSVLEVRVASVLVNVEGSEEEGRISLIYDEKIGEVTIELEVGKAKVTRVDNPKGPVQTLLPNQLLRVTREGKLSEVLIRLTAPTLIEPADGSHRSVSKHGKELSFAWEDLREVPGLEPARPSYQFEVARDEHFSELVFETSLTTASITLDYLDPGKLFWRVRPFQRMKDGRRIFGPSSLVYVLYVSR